MTRYEFNTNFISMLDFSSTHFHYRIPQYCCLPIYSTINTLLSCYVCRKMPWRSLVGSLFTVTSSVRPSTRKFCQHWSALDCRSFARLLLSSASPCSASSHPRVVVRSSQLHSSFSCSWGVYTRLYSYCKTICHFSFCHLVSLHLPLVLF